MNFVSAPRMRDPERAAWTLLRFARRPMSLADIVLGDGLPENTGIQVSDAVALLDRWRGAGLVELTDNRGFYIMLKEAKALRDPPAVPAPARQPAARSTRQRIWSAIRVMRAFDLVEVCFAATVEKAAARRVLNQLTRAGYLIRTDQPGDDHPRWRLGRACGPKHPSIEYAGRTVIALIDRNSGARFPLSPTQKILAPEIHHVS